ncbi:hypothetical protein EI94DRAFT_1701504 [Lactarius quietus]|nr:hypothetical protein EI94DRAFT_1701504 [Lactarius quietus]
MTLTIATSAAVGVPTIMTKMEKPECLNKRVQTAKLAAQSWEIEQLREASTLEHSQTNSLCKDLRNAKEKLQTELGFLHWELGITWSRLMDTKWELKEAQWELENAHQELENSRQELRNTQWVLEFTWQQHQQNN